MFKNTKGFTLVELIVVITILAILGTIAFLSFQGYSKSSRDSVRITDIQSMKKSLELFSLQTSKFPQPSGKTSILYKGASVWNQGSFGESVATQVARLNKLPLDPLTGTQYGYSVLNGDKEYELSAALETDEIGLLSSTYAGNTTATAYISGNYNGVTAKVSTGGLVYILALPSITSSDLSSIQVVDIVQNSDLVLNGSDSLPVVYSDTTFNVVGSVNNNQTVVEVYSGATIPATFDDINTLVLNLQIAYSGASFSNTLIDSIIFLDSENDYDAVSKMGLLLVNENMGGDLDLADVTYVPLIDQERCEGAGWVWVGADGDFYGNGYCLGGVFGGGFTSWNGYGTSYGGWDTTGLIDSGSAGDQRGLTRYLDTPLGYSCTSLGSANSGFIGSDTIEGRMQWLNTNGNTESEMQTINWISNALPPSGGIPAIFVADCLDGVKDLTTDMDTVSYADYTKDETNDDYYSSFGRWNTTIALDRRAYMSEWTQRKGSHVPSALEHTAACNNGDFNPSTGHTTWLGSISDGNQWHAFSSRMLNGHCDYISANVAGSQNYNFRIIVRP